MYKIILPILVLSLFGCGTEEKINNTDNKPTFSISEQEYKIENQFREFLKNPDHEMLVESDKKFITPDELKKTFALPEQQLTISSKYYELEKFVFDSIKFLVSVKYNSDLEQFDIVFYSETPNIISYFKLIDVYKDNLVNPLRLFKEGKLNSTDLKYFKSDNKTAVFKNGKFDFQFERRSKIRKHTVSEMFLYRLGGMDISEAKSEIEKAKSNLKVIQDMLKKEKLEKQYKIIDKAYSATILREKILSGLKITDLTLGTKNGYYFINFNWKTDSFYEIESIECYLEYLDENDNVIGFEDVYGCLLKDLNSTKMGTRATIIQNVDAARNAKSLNLKIKEIRLPM